MLLLKNTHSTTRFIHGTARIVSVSAATLVLLAAAGYADAASFPCRQKLSGSEKLVCNDPELSSLDDRLAKLYSRAIDLAPDREALEANRISQWKWRQQHCTDKECVKNWYVRRIGELDANIQQGQQAEIAALKANVVAQNLSSDAQQAVLELKGAQSSPVTDKQ